MSGFRRGFTNRNPLVLVAAVALLVPAMLGFEWLFTSGVWTNIPLDRALRNPQDSFTYVSWMTGRARLEPPGTPCLYLLGGSSARESIVSGDALAAEIAQDGGPRVAAYDFGSLNQTFAESMAVVDTVPDTPAWLLVGVNLGRFTATRQENAAQAGGRELLLRAPAIRDFVASRWGLAQHQFTILPGIWSYLTEWARAHGRDTLGGRPPSTQYELHHYGARTRRSDSQKERLVARWNASRRPVFDANVAANLQMLEALLVSARERGVRVALVELPLNAAIVRGRFAASQARYQGPVAALARKYGAPYVDLNRSLQIPSADFQDLSHLIGPGRVIWQRALAKVLARVLTSDGSRGGSG